MGASGSVCAGPYVQVCTDYWSSVTVSRLLVYLFSFTLSAHYCPHTRRGVWHDQSGDAAHDQDSVLRVGQGRHSSQLCCPLVCFFCTPPPLHPRGWGRGVSIIALILFCHGTFAEQRVVFVLQSPPAETGCSVDFSFSRFSRLQVHPHTARCPGHQQRGLHGRRCVGVCVFVCVGGCSCVPLHALQLHAGPFRGSCGGASRPTAWSTDRA